MYLHIWDLGHVEEEEVVGHTQRPPSEKGEATGTLRTDEAQRVFDKVRAGLWGGKHRNNPLHYPRVMRYGCVRNIVVAVTTIK